MQYFPAVPWSENKCSTKQTDSAVFCVCNCQCTKPPDHYNNITWMCKSENHFQSIISHVRLKLRKSCLMYKWEMKFPFFSYCSKCNPGLHWVIKDKCSECLCFCHQLSYLFHLTEWASWIPVCPALSITLCCLFVYFLFRFYLGHWQEGIGKLFSFGGLGVWTLTDVILISLHYLGPADGTLYIYESKTWFSLSNYAVILIQLWNHLNNNVSNEFIIYK
jgi:hypothetical protein